MSGSGWMDLVHPSRQPLRGLLRMRFSSLVPSKIYLTLRSAEGASRSTHQGSAGLPIGRRFSPALILLLAILALAGCGKKGNPQAPPGEPDTYPRTYPSG
jgi:hypothetical protein